MVMTLMKTTFITIPIIITTNLLHSGPDDKVSSGEDEKSTGEEEGEVDRRHQEARARPLRL